MYLAKPDSALVFPARAGMSRPLGEADLCFRCVPRASGDEPEAVDAIKAQVVCSPRERG